jgi:hypothetical protein
MKNIHKHSDEIKIWYIFDYQYLHITNTATNESTIKKLIIQQ